MAVQRHEKIKQHRGPRPSIDEEQFFFVLSHAPACGSHVLAWDFHAPTWATNMSPNLVYFNAHPRRFDGGL